MQIQLNPKHQKFVQEYTSTGNASKAAQSAGYGNGDTYSRVAGHRLITNDNIQRVVQEQSEAVGLNIERVLERLAQIISKGKDSDSIQAIKVWTEITGANAPTRMSLVNSVVNAPKTPEEIDVILAQMSRIKEKRNKIDTENNS